MKCPYCGAEIKNNSKVCEYCDSQISVTMQKEQEQLNKATCPKCGSTNIQFTRENAGEVRGKSHKQIVHHTVGYCKNCGYTWYPKSETTPVPKKRKTWLWVLGWLFIFPVPLTILMLRKKDMKPVLKYGIIAVAWIIYLIIGMGGNKSDVDTTTAQGTASLSSAHVSTEKESAASDLSSETIDSTLQIELVAGELGEYGQLIVLNEGTEFPDPNYCYFVPTGTYQIKNIGEFPTQVDINKNELAKETDSNGNEYDVWAEGTPYVISVGSTETVTIKDNYFIEIEEPTHLLLSLVG